MVLLLLSLSLLLNIDSGVVIGQSINKLHALYAGGIWKHMPSYIIFIEVVWNFKF